MRFPLIRMHWHPKCPLIMPYWKRIKTTSLFFTTHWLLIILITIFHQVHQIKSTLKKCTDFQLEGIRISIVVKNCLIFMKCDKETIGRVLIVYMMLGFYQTICQENGFLTRGLSVFFENGNTKDYLYTTKRIWNSALNPH